MLFGYNHEIESVHWHRCLLSGLPVLYKAPSKTYTYYVHEGSILHHFGQILYIEVWLRPAMTLSSGLVQCVFICNSKLQASGFIHYYWYFKVFDVCRLHLALCLHNPRYVILFSLGRLRAKQ